MTTERRHWRLSGVFIVNFFTPSSSVVIVDFEQVMFAEIFKYFSSFTRKKKFHHVFLKSCTHFLTHSRQQSLSCRNQSIWFAVNWFVFIMSEMVVWNKLRTPSLWNKREWRNSNSHIRTENKRHIQNTENKRRIQNPVKHLFFAKIVLQAKGSILAENRWLFSQDAPSLMVATDLNTLLKYGNVQGEKFSRTSRSIIIQSAYKYLKSFRFHKDYSAWKVAKYASFSGPHFPGFGRIRTKYGEILRISPYSVRIWGNTDQKNLRIWALFTQCYTRHFYRLWPTDQNSSNF